MKIGGKIGISRTKDINNAQIAPPIGKLVAASGDYGMYGLRKVKDDYTGNCIKLRKDGESETVDIGFDAFGILNEAAILSHCGSSTHSQITQEVTKAKSVESKTRNKSIMHKVAYLFFVLVILFIVPTNT